MPLNRSTEGHQPLDISLTVHFICFAFEGANDALCHFPQKQVIFTKSGFIVLDTPFSFQIWKTEISSYFYLYKHIEVTSKGHFQFKLHASVVQMQLREWTSPGLVSGVHMKPRNEGSGVAFHLGHLLMKLFSFCSQQHIFSVLLFSV